MTVEIRRARPEDAEDLARVGLSAWLNGIGPHLLPEVRDRVAQENPFVPFIRDMGPALLVAVVDGAPVGLAACERGDDVITDVWVAPEYAGRGAGSALVYGLERSIAERGFAEARLEVLTENRRAAALYLHLGYRVVWRAVKRDEILQLDLDKTGMSKPLR